MFPPYGKKNEKINRMIQLFRLSLTVDLVRAGHSTPSDITSVHSAHLSTPWICIRARYYGDRGFLLPNRAGDVRCVNAFFHPGHKIGKNCSMTRQVYSSDFSLDILA